MAEFMTWPCTIWETAPMKIRGLRNVGLGGKEQSVTVYVRGNAPELEAVEYLHFGRAGGLGAAQLQLIPGRCPNHLVHLAIGRIELRRVVSPGVATAHLKLHRVFEGVVVPDTKIRDDFPGDGKFSEVLGDVLLEDHVLTVVHVMGMVDEIELDIHSESPRWILTVWLATPTNWKAVYYFMLRYRTNRNQLSSLESLQPMFHRLGEAQPRPVVGARIRTVTDGRVSVISSSSSCRSALP
jgi:hypothetical protein